MKKLLTVLVITIATSLVFNLGMSKTALAQDGLNEGDISIGANIGYGFDIEEIGIGVNGTYVLKPNMRLGADFTYWLTEDNDIVSVTFLEVNANFHYIFYNEEDLMAYGIGSLGIHSASVDSNVDTDFGNFGYSASETELGIGVGAGIEYNLGSVALFAEPRLFLSGFEQLSLTAGARVAI